VSSLPASNSPVISIQDLYLSYKTNVSKKPNFKEALIGFGRGKKATRQIDALKGVSLDIYQGTVLGVIGANGAGKSTLMKAVAGILPPSKGEIHIQGKVSAMLSLGVGFNPNLTGRENVYLGGLAAGLSSEEIDESFEAVLDFADIGDHIDMPMRTYSAGMYGRLGFAVATTIQPEILVIDEALSAGDAAFKEKSSDRIQELCRQAKTLLVVSHGLSTIEEICTDAIWLDHGNLMMTGKPKAVIDAYTEFLHVGDASASREDF
jgi:ABC-type polysaccharide/polyol phosphate transport system ATPase subunit